MACSYCRHRKRRCDGLKPTCGPCKARNIACTYIDRSSNTSQSPCPARTNPVIGNHSIEVIESLLQSHTAALKGLQDSLRSPRAGASIIPANSDACNSVDSHNGIPTDAVADSIVSQPSPGRSIPKRRHSKPKSPYMQEQTSELPALTIPPGHEAGSSALLSLPQVEALAGEFPDEFFFRVEAHHAKVMDSCSSHTVTADSSDIPQVGREAADMFLQAFFDHVHPFHPIFERKAFSALYEETFSKGLYRNEESGVLLIILALGAVMSEDPDGKHTLGGRTIPGMHYYKTAQQILMSRWTQSMGGNLLLSQGLLLCALYLTYAVQPLLAWKFVHTASTNVEQLLIRTKNTEPNEPRVQEILRLSWSCFVIECDILAEFHQPRSCIQLLADKMLFPQSGDLPDTSRMFFLAEISARSLGNRIHYSINFADSMSTYTDNVLGDVSDGTSIANSLAPLINVCNELTRQLELWYSSLPAAIKPELMVEEPDPDIQSCLLRCRYWSSMNKIHRPFVLKATSLPIGQQIPRYVLEKCQTCIMSCRMFLKSVGGLLVKRTPYIYTATQGAFASALMISISARSPILKAFVSDVDALQKLALDRLRPWVENGSAAESAYDILNSIRKKFVYSEGM